MIDVKRYMRLKAEGHVKIVNETVQFDRYDVETGQLSEPEVQKINLEEISVQRSKLQKEIDAIDSFLKDVKQS
jgi:hypothetical protein